MIRGTVVIEGSPKGMVKQFRQFVKEGLFWLIQNWHRETLIRHFKPEAKQRYKYEPRSIKYLRYKAKKRPMAGPLEFSGRSKRELTRAVRVSGTAKKAKGAMSAPRYFWMTPKNQPDKSAEATVVTKKETLDMAKKLNEKVTKQLNQVKDRQVIR